MRWFKDIPGFEGRYCVTSDGKVWAQPNRLHAGKYLKPSLKKGYEFVCLCLGPYVYQRTVHRLVAQSFVTNPKHLPQVNHIDSDKRNNCATNLEWCTASHNKKHSWDVGTSFTTEAKRAASSRNAYLMHKARGLKHV